MFPTQWGKPHLKSSFQPRSQPLPNFLSLEVSIQGDTEEEEAEPSFLQHSWPHHIDVMAAPLLVLMHLCSFSLHLQIGFRMQMSTGQVDTSRVFGPGGRYSLGVDFTFKEFPADAHFATLNDLSVFSRDRYTCDNIDENWMLLLLL